MASSTSSVLRGRAFFAGRLLTFYTVRPLGHLVLMLVLLVAVWTVPAHVAGLAVVTPLAVLYTWLAGHQPAMQVALPSRDRLIMAVRVVAALVLVSVGAHWPPWDSQGIRALQLHAVLMVAGGGIDWLWLVGQLLLVPVFVGWSRVAAASQDGVPPPLLTDFLYGRRASRYRWLLAQNLLLVPAVALVPVVQPRLSDASRHRAAAVEMVLAWQAGDTNWPTAVSVPAAELAELAATAAPAVGWLAARGDIAALTTLLQPLTTAGGDASVLVLVLQPERQPTAGPDQGRWLASAVVRRALQGPEGGPLPARFENWLAAEPGHHPEERRAALGAWSELAGRQQALLGAWARASKACRPAAPPDLAWRDPPGFLLQVGTCIDAPPWRAHRQSVLAMMRQDEARRQSWARPFGTAPATVLLLPAPAKGKRFPIDSLDRRPTGAARHAGRFAQSAFQDATVRERHLWTFDQRGHPGWLGAVTLDVVPVRNAACGGRKRTCPDSLGVRLAVDSDRPMVHRVLHDDTGCDRGACLADVPEGVEVRQVTYASGKATATLDSRTLVSLLEDRAATDDLLDLVGAHARRTTGYRQEITTVTLETATSRHELAPLVPDATAGQPVLKFFLAAPMLANPTVKGDCRALADHHRLPRPDTDNADFAWHDHVEGDMTEARIRLDSPKLPDLCILAPMIPATVRPEPDR